MVRVVNAGLAAASVSMGVKVTMGTPISSAPCANKTSTVRLTSRRQ